MAGLRAFTLSVGLVLIQGFGIGAARAGDEPTPQPGSGIPGDRPYAMLCAPNALYMLLKLQGRPVSHAQVVRELTSPNQSPTRPEFRDAAARLGLSLRMRRYTVESLDQCPVPFVAHCKSDHMKPPDGLNHYWLVLKVGKEKFTYLDGATGHFGEGLRSKFPIYWTGDVLELTPEEWPGSRVAMIACGLVYAAAIGVVVFLSRRRSPPLGRKLGVGTLLVACWGAGGVTPVAASGPSPANSGVGGRPPCRLATLPKVIG